MTARERFFRKVSVGESCWNWSAGTNDLGYGVFWMGGKNTYAHRTVLVLCGSVIPDGHDVDHKCRNRRCVNPAHLRVVTERVNSLENSAGPTAINAAKTHCSRGHEFTPENTKVYRGKNYTSRTCKICRRLLEARRRELGKAQP